MERTMSTTFTSRPAAGPSTAEAAGYGGLVDAIGGIATVILAIIALAGIRADALAPIAIIVFGAALLIQGGAMLSEYAHVALPMEPTMSAEQFGGGSLSATFLVGAAGIILGVLALLGIAAQTLVAVAVIAFGAALVISSNSVRQLYLMRTSTMRTMGSHTGTEFLAGEMASGSASVQLLAGLAAIVLGILAVSGVNPLTLILAALIVLGATIVLSGSTLSGIVLGFVAPATPQQTTP
jgi:hypothetical protein